MSIITIAQAIFIFKIDFLSLIILICVIESIQRHMLRVLLLDKLDEKGLNVLLKPSEFHLQIKFPRNRQQQQQQQQQQEQHQQQQEQQEQRDSSETEGEQEDSDTTQEEKQSRLDQIEKVIRDYHYSRLQYYNNTEQERQQNQTEDLVQ
jgi:hypothetical protein